MSAISPVILMGGSSPIAYSTESRWPEIVRGGKVIRNEDIGDDHDEQFGIGRFLKRIDELFERIRQRDLDPIELLEDAVRRHDEENGSQ